MSNILLFTSLAMNNRIFWFVNMTFQIKKELRRAEQTAVTAAEEKRRFGWRRVLCVDDVTLKSLALVSRTHTVTSCHCTPDNVKHNTASRTLYSSTQERGEISFSFIFRNQRLTLYSSHCIVGHMSGLWCILCIQKVQMKDAV